MSEAGRSEAESATCRVVRRALGLTQAQWAAVLNAAPMTVSKWERGLLAPDDRTRVIFARLSERTAEEAMRLGGAMRAALESKGSLEAFRLLLEAMSRHDPENRQ